MEFTNREPLALFEYSVKRIIELGKMNESNTHKAWANVIFSNVKNANERSELMSIVKREYSTYFDNSLQYAFLVDKIEANFPQFFESNKHLGLSEIIQQALNAELEEQRNPKNKKKYKVSSCERIPSSNSKYIYKASLKVEEGDDPHFSEGMPLEYLSGYASYTCDIIEYDYVNATLYFSSDKQILYNSKSYVISDATINIIALIKRLENFSLKSINPNQPLYKFLTNKTKKLSKIKHNDYPSYLDDLLSKDKSQANAFNASLDNDITFIWGPPGTGKSYTLAAIIMALYNMKDERTAVCCLSNIAVDQLVNKVVKIINVNEPDMARCKFYRAGRTKDPELLETDFLFPDDDESISIREQIKLRNSKIDRLKKRNKNYSDKAIQIKTELKDLRERLKNHTDHLINKVNVVFSTISNFVINTRLREGIFDNLIIDEASMLAKPQLIALAMNVTKRIILVGDFQQLSPITVAQIPILKDNVFKLCGIDINHIDHPALHQLLNQRRSNPKLVDIINRPFYNNQLIAQNNKNHPIVARAPYSGCVLGMKCIPDGEVRFTKGGTRQNKANAEAAMDLLDIYSNDSDATFSIGIITPYKGQVALLKALFSEKQYSLDFQERIKIGTVHTFQGSECDVIIFDMVDCYKFEDGKKSYFGKIYTGEQGEQLINVAISRARHKLIVICDPEFIRDSPGQTISDKSYKIFQNLLKAKSTKL